MEKNKLVEENGNAFDSRYITLDEVEEIIHFRHPFRPLNEFYNSSNMAYGSLLLEKSLQKILNYHIEDRNRAFIVISAQRGSWTDDIPEESEIYGETELLLIELSEKYNFEILDKEEKSFIKQLKDNYKKFYNDNDELFLKISEKFKRDRELNNTKTKSLKQDLSQSKFSYMPVYGGFIENKGTPIEQAIFEASFLVFNILAKANHPFVPYEELFDWGVWMIKRYSQDSFLYKRGDHNPYYIDKNGKIDDRHFFTGEHQIDNYAAEYFTQIKQFKPQNDSNEEYNDKFGGVNKRFTYKTKYDENKIFIGFFKNSPTWQTINEHRMRQGGGEVHNLDEIYG